MGGYKEDTVRKKSLLLAMILNDRPETFLPLRDDEQIAPITDDHFMRSCLRIGLIDVLDGELETKGNTFNLSRAQPFSNTANSTGRTSLRWQQ